MSFLLLQLLLNIPHSQSADIFNTLCMCQPSVFRILCGYGCKASSIRGRNLHIQHDPLRKPIPKVYALGTGSEVRLMAGRRMPHPGVSGSRCQVREAVWSSAPSSNRSLPRAAMTLQDHHLCQCRLLISIGMVCLVVAISWPWLPRGGFGVTPRKLHKF